MAPLKLLHYQRDFRELHGVLDRPEYANASVLGTFDIQLASWWEYKRRYLYLPDIFNTTLPDSVVELRVYQFLRLAGASTEEFGRLLDSPYFINRVVGGSTYQANSLFTPWPLYEYSADARRRIASSPPTWNVEMPESEKVRLMRAYDRAGEVRQRDSALDIIVLD